jgi:hypothetical protein
MWRPLLRNNHLSKKRLLRLENSFVIEAIFFFMRTFLIVLTFAVGISAFSADSSFVPFFAVSSTNVGTTELNLANRPKMTVKMTTKMTTEQKQKWMQDIDVESVSLIFAAADLGNAPSSFGHVFLKLNSNKNKTRTGLLDYGVNFAARTGDITGALYAWYGLLGYFQGTYNLVPFHQMIKDYTHLEGRDIWEFRLKMTPQQVQFLVRYLLEVDGQYYDYYFFNQNCASFIWKLLMAVYTADISDTSLFKNQSTEVNLYGTVKESYFSTAESQQQQGNEFFVLPIEVVDRLYRLNLLEEPIVRPSLETQWRQMKSQLSPEETQHLISASTSTSPNLSMFTVQELQAGQMYWTLQSLKQPVLYRPIAFAYSKELAARGTSSNTSASKLHTENENMQAHEDSPHAAREDCRSPFSRLSPSQPSHSRGAGRFPSRVRHRPVCLAKLPPSGPARS